jgi:membrane-associated phospholipid phosphatase
MPYVKVTWLNPGARQREPLAKLDDVTPDTPRRVLADLVPDTLSVSRVANDVVGAGRAATQVDWLRAGAVSTGLVLGASLLDTRAFRFAQYHADSAWVRHGVTVGNAIPWLALGGAGLAAIDGSDPRRSRTGFAGVEAGATAIALTQGLKLAVGRARPTTGLGHASFDTGARTDAFWSFPSTHSVVAWAALTPFAIEYDMPWLYGVAGLTNLARIGSRQHWVSDTVASSLLGYGLGRLFWQSGRDQAQREPKLFFDGSGLSMFWPW